MPVSYTHLDVYKRQAVVIGVAVFGEPFTVQGAAGILLIVAAVTIVILYSGSRKA